jgi:DNA-binding HxlR family transcriptional regulator
METVEDAESTRPAAILILAGHSHLSALTINHLKVPPELSAVTHRENLHVLEGGWPRDEAYWQALVEHAADADIALVWGGNEHNVGFFFQAAFAFDFLSNKVKKLIPSFQIVSQSKIKRRYNEISLDELDEVLKALRERGARSVTLVGTPPPKRDNEMLRKLLEKEPYFCDWAAQLGQSTDEIKITEPHIRLKLWYLLQEMIAEIGRRHGARFIPVASELQDEDGFLLEQYSFPDVTHANAAYGEVMLRKVLEEIAG